MYLLLLLVGIRLVQLILIALFVLWLPEQHLLLMLQQPILLKQQRLLALLRPRHVGRGQ